MSDDALIEAMARAMAEANYDDVLDEQLPWTTYIHEATASLAAYRKHQQEAGIVEVPRSSFKVKRTRVYKGDLAAAQEREG